MELIFLSIFWQLIILQELKRREKSRPNAESKQTFGLQEKLIFRGEKSRQNAENKQTFGLTGKIESNEKIHQNAENKQTIFVRKNENKHTFDLTWDRGELWLRAVDVL